MKSPGKNAESMSGTGETGSSTLHSFLSRSLKEGLTIFYSSVGYMSGAVRQHTLFTLTDRLTSLDGSLHLRFFPTNYSR